VESRNLNDCFVEDLEAVVESCFERTEVSDITHDHHIHYNQNLDLEDRPAEPKCNQDKEHPSEHENQVKA
jgi:hypothetical protein